MKTPYYKKLWVLQYSPELKARTLRVDREELNSMAEYIIDSFHLHTLRPVSKSEFVSAVTRSLCLGAPPVSSYGIFINEMAHKAFNLAVACGAIKYTPRKNLLPGETE